MILSDNYFLNLGHVNYVFFYIYKNRTSKINLSPNRTCKMMIFDIHYLSTSIIIIFIIGEIKNDCF